MRPPVRSKKMACFGPRPRQGVTAGQHASENGPHRSDGKPQIPAGPTRADGRTGRRRPAPGMARTGSAQGQRRWRCRPGPRPFRSGRGRRRRRSGRSAAPEISFRRGDAIDVAFANELPGPAVLNWRGLGRRCERRTADGRGRRSPAGARETQQLPLRHAGTFLCELACSVTARRGRRGRGHWWSGKPSGSGRSRRGVSGRAMAAAPRWNRDRAGDRPKDATPVLTANGRLSLDIAVRTNERIRIRFINGCPARCYRGQNRESGRRGSWPSTASPPSRSRPATARWCWRPAAGSTPLSM